MKVDGKGAVTGSIVMETSAQSGIPAIRITMDSTQSSERATVTMECHVANIGEAKLTLTTTHADHQRGPQDRALRGRHDCGRGPGGRAAGRAVNACKHATE